MRFKGYGDSSIHITQVQVSASLLSRGVPIAEVVKTIFDATRKAARDAGKSSDWSREWQDIEEMCRDWLTKHPEIGNAPSSGIVKLTFFDELVKLTPKVWGIKGVFARGETSSWVGPPGGGKSGLLTDITVHKAAGIDWRGYRTKGAEGVVYFALERGDLVKRRLTAYQMRDGYEKLPIAVTPKSSI